MRTAILSWRRTRAAAAAPAAVSLCGCAGPQSMLSPAGPVAGAIAGTWWLMFAGAVVILAIVCGLALYATLRRPGERPLRDPVRFIVLGGLVLPTIVLAALLVHGTEVGRRAIGVGEATDDTIRVTASQWRWRFDHLDDDGAVVATQYDRLVLPAGRMVEFRLASDDVIHAFWIPRLGGKLDAIPGRDNRLRLRIGEAATMSGQCAEFCGLEHAAMRFDVEVLEADRFDAWLASEGARAAVAAAPEARR